MPELSRIAAILLKLQALEEPKLIWQDDVSRDDIQTISQASQHLAERAGDLLQEWARTGQADPEKLGELEQNVDVLLGALGQLPQNHPAQRNINLSKVLLRINPS